MPKQTFFNLPEGKRQRILDAAIAEIGSKPFEKVSVSNIVEKAEIPRGSFYQYFEDLKDLYRHILQTAGEQKMVYLQDVVGQLDNWDAFRIIRELYVEGLRFAAENPRLAAVANSFFREDLSLKKEIFPDLEKQGLKFFEMILLRGRGRGEVNPEVNIGMAAFVLYNLTNAVTDYYVQQTEAGKDLFAEKDQYLELAEKMLYIVEMGLRSRNNEDVSS